MEWLVVVGVAVLFIAALLRGKFVPQQAIAYQWQGPLFSAAERSFFGVLKEACGDRAEVFGKVRVADVLSPAKGQGRSGWQKAFNRIAAKHFDYVICKPGDLSVIAAIELNDGSHAQRRRGDRDAFLLQACSSAGLTLHQFDAKRGYQIAAVQRVLFPENGVVHTSAVDVPPVGSPPEAKPLQGEAPTCPKCGAALVRRIASKGKHQGQTFLACTAFPTCRYIGEAEA